MKFNMFFIVLAGGIVFLMTLANVRLAIGMLFFSIAVSPEISVGAITMRLEDLLIPIMVFAWLTDHIEKRRKFVSSPLFLPLGLFIVFCAFSTFWNMALGTISRQLFAMMYLLKIIEYSLILLMVVNIVKTRQEVQTYMIVIAVGMLAANIYGVVQYYNPQLIDPTQAAGRVYGPYGETSNIFGGFLVFMFFLLLGYLHGVSDGLTKIFLGLLILMTGFNLFYTFSRTSYVAFMLGLVMAFFLISKRLIIPVLVVIMLMPFVFGDAPVQRATEILSVVKPDEVAPSSWVARVNAWKGALPVVVASPFIGSGLGAYKLGDIDSEYVIKLIEIGVLGFLSFIFLMLSMVFIGYRITRFSQDRYFRMLGAGYFCGICSMMVHFLAATSFTAIRGGETLFFLTGLMIIIEKLALKKKFYEWTSANRMKPLSKPATSRPAIEFFTRE